jgi:hypothetical protein
MHGGVEPLRLLFYKLDLKEFQSSVPEIKTIFCESLGKQSINKGEPIFIWSVLLKLTKIGVSRFLPSRLPN